MQGKPLNMTRAPHTKLTAHPLFGPLATALGAGIEAWRSPRMANAPRSAGVAGHPVVMTTRIPGDFHILPVRRSVHDVAEGFAEECAAAGVGPLHPHVEQALLGIKSGVRIDDQPLEGRMLSVAPGDE
jgi:hypothetical protein